MSVKANRAGALMMSPALRNPTPNSLHPSSSKGDPSRWLNCPPTAWAVVKRLSAWAASRAMGTLMAPSSSASCASTGTSSARCVSR